MEICFYIYFVGYTGHVGV